MKGEKKGRGGGGFFLKLGCLSVCGLSWEGRLGGLDCWFWARSLIYICLRGEVEVWVSRWEGGVEDLSTLGRYGRFWGGEGGGELSVCYG